MDEIVRHKYTQYEIVPKLVAFCFLDIIFLSIFATFLSADITVNEVKTASSYIHNIYKS